LLGGQSDPHNCSDVVDFVAGSNNSSSCLGFPRYDRGGVRFKNSKTGQRWLLGKAGRIDMPPRRHGSSHTTGRCRGAGGRFTSVAKRNKSRRSFYTNRKARRDARNRRKPPLTKTPVVRRAAPTTLPPPTTLSPPTTTPAVSVPYPAFSTTETAPARKSQCLPGAVVRMTTRSRAKLVESSEAAHSTPRALYDFMDHCVSSTERCR